MSASVVNPQITRLTTAQRSGVIWGRGALLYDTDLTSILLGDGVTAGGVLYSAGGASLPSQVGHTGQYLTTDGTSPSWAAIDLSTYATQSWVTTQLGSYALTSALPAPGGSASEIQYREGPTTFGALAHVARSPNGNLLLASQADPATLSDGELWYGSLGMSGRDVGLTKRLSGLIFVGTADSTITNTAVETSLMPPGVGSLTIPAAYWSPGRVLRLRASGDISAASGSYQVRLFAGATVLFASMPYSLVVANNYQWWYELLIACRAVGASGSLMTTVMGFSQAYGGGAPRQLFPGSAQVPVTLDLTGPLTIDLRWLFTVAAAGNVITTHNAILEG